MYPRDIFISHAFVDKISHARPLNSALHARGLSTWLDEAQILDGENFVQGIGWGLDRAELVVFLVTDNFIGRRWAEKELTTALSREISEGTTKVIAVLDVADPSAVFDRFPLLRDKLYIPWSVGIDSIADRLRNRFTRQIANWHIKYHPVDYVGDIWTRIVPETSRQGQSHVITLLWGPYIYTHRLETRPDSPLSLVHHKIYPDSLPLYIHVEPPAIVTIGQGPAPDLDQLNIDEGWVRMAGAEIKHRIHPDVDINYKS